jgi:excisionase family DNA binding protein
MTRLTEAARRVRIPERTVRDWVYADRLAATRQGRTIHVNQADIDELAAQYHEATATRRTERLAETGYRRYDSVDSRGLSPEPSPAIDLDPMSGASPLPEAR